MTEPTDPWAPPPEGWVPGGPGGQWPAAPRQSPWSADVAAAGVPLAVAVFLTFTTGWWLLRAALHAAVEASAGAAFSQEFVPAPRTFFQEHWEWVGTGGTALAAIAAWVAFALLRRARRPDGAALIPYGVLAAPLGLVGGFVLVDVVGAWLSELAVR